MISYRKAICLVAFLIFILLTIIIGRAQLQETSQVKNEADVLPWERDYATAMAKAKAEGRPLFLMFEGGSSKQYANDNAYEAGHTFDARNREALKSFVWVRSYAEDIDTETLQRKFRVGGWPNYLFIDSQTEKVMAVARGGQDTKGMLSAILEATKALNLPLDQELAALETQIFKPDQEKISSYLDSGDIDGLTKYLAPAQEDILRSQNWLVGKVTVPAGVSKDDVIIKCGGYDWPRAIYKNGNFVIDLMNANKARLHIWAPGCRQLEYDPTKEDGAVQKQEFELQPVEAKDAVSFSGTVVLPNGAPASDAIVRICDWGVTRTNAQGEYKIENISPGTFKVRSEAPGGEFETTLTFVAGQNQTQQLPLQAVTTVGIRWAAQTVEGSPNLVGDGVRSGEAYFSMKSSRFNLLQGVPYNNYGGDFMMQLTGAPLFDQILTYVKSPDDLNNLKAAPPGTPFLWLFDTNGNNGLHKESQSFDSIETVNSGAPFDNNSYFQFLRGPLVRKGDVYTVHCVTKNCYAKMEITDVTEVTSPGAIEN